MEIEDIIKKSQEEFSTWELEQFGYETKTDFFGQFTAAEAFDDDVIQNVRKKYAELKEASKDNVERFTELVMIVNHRSWLCYEHIVSIKKKMNVSEFAVKKLIEEFTELGRLYTELYYDARDYGYDHFKGKDLDYMFNTLD